MERGIKRHELLAVLQTNLPVGLAMLAGGALLVVFGAGRAADLAAGVLIGLGLPVVLSRLFS